MEVYFERTIWVQLFFFLFMWFPFRPFEFLWEFNNRFTIAVMFGATSSTWLNMFLKPKNGIFQMPDPAGWMQGK